MYKYTCFGTLVLQGGDTNMRNPVSNWFVVYIGMKCIIKTMWNIRLWNIGAGCCTMWCWEKKLLHVVEYHYKSLNATYFLQLCTVNVGT